MNRTPITSLTSSVSFSRLRAIGLCVIVATAACTKPENNAVSDTGQVAAAPAAMSDTTAAGDHAGMAGMSNTPAKDADQEFLRMMADHHQGFIEMVDEAMEKATRASAKADSKKMHDAQHKERDQMVAMIKKDYGEAHMPMIMPSNKAMNDSLEAMPAGAGYDRELYRKIIAHHQEGVKMIDQFLPRLTRPAVKQMAEKMRADQTREIAMFQKKSGT